MWTAHVSLHWSLVQFYFRHYKAHTAVLQIQQQFHSDIAQTQCRLTSADSGGTQSRLLIWLVCSAPGLQLMTRVPCSSFTSWICQRKCTALIAFWYIGPAYVCLHTRASLLFFFKSRLCLESMWHLICPVVASQRGALLPSPRGTSLH